MRLNIEYNTICSIKNADLIFSKSLNIEINNLKFEVNRRLLKILDTYQKDFNENIQI